MEQLHAIPFTVTISSAEIDRGLSAKLLREAEGILAWAVAGAHRWYSEGLGRPSAVTETTEAWRADMDKVAPFLEEICELGDQDRWVEQSGLRTAYLDWCERRGDKYPLSSQGFNTRLENKGLIRGKAERNSKRVWFGVRFKR